MAADAGRVETAAVAGADSSRASPGVRSADWRPSIAVVDDDSGFSSYARAFLEARGYEVRTYTRGDEIVAVVRRGSPPDIVLLDVEMPGMDGLETLKALKAAQLELPVIMLAGGEHAAIIVESMRLGAEDYVVKSGDPDGLEYVADDVGFLDTATDNATAAASPLADYGTDLTNDDRVNTAVAGLLGVALTLSIGYVVFWLARRTRSNTTGPSPQP